MCQVHRDASFVPVDVATSHTTAGRVRPAAFTGARVRASPLELELPATSVWLLTLVGA